MEMRKLNRGSQRRAYEPEPEWTEAPAEIEETIPPAEEWLLKLFFIVAAEDSAALVQTQAEWLSSPTIRNLVATHLAALEAGEWDGQVPLFDRFESERERRTLAGALAEVREIPRPVEQYADILRRLHGQHINNAIAQISARLKDPRTPEAELVGLVAELSEMKRQKQSRPPGADSEGVAEAGQ